MKVRHRRWHGRPSCPSIGTIPRLSLRFETRHRIVQVSFDPLALVLVARIAKLLPEPQQRCVVAEVPLGHCNPASGSWTSYFSYRSESVVGSGGTGLKA